ncbi:MAG: SufE family protein [Rickettsiales bacterium]|jgi:cysteine desulfuration protein SufE|nr:SufE family protein [Rickettsiales bacterium]
MAGLIQMKYEEIKLLLMSVSDPVERLEAVMDLGRQLAEVPQAAVCADIFGCASRVQICRNGNRFYGTADSALVRGIVAIIISLVDGKTSDDIKRLDLRAEFGSLGLNLGAGRMNGVNSMISFLENL